MLSFFRRGITAKIMLGVLALGLFAIVITGFGTGGLGGLGGLSSGGATVLAKAGDERVTATEITDQINRQLTRAREQQPELDIANFIRTGAFEGILDQLISAKALLSFGHDIGLGVSKRMVDGEITSVPAFQNLAGKFDNTTFHQALVRERITEQQLRNEIEQGVMQQQIMGPVMTNAQVPQGVALGYASLLLERRMGSIGLVSAQAMPSGAEPTAAEINTFYNQQKTRYTIPERRVIRYAIFGAGQLGEAAMPTNAEIEAYYRANATRYAGQETRSFSRVILPDQKAAQLFAAKLQRGTSFSQAAAEAGFSNADTRIVDQNKTQFTNLTSPAVADAAFAAAEGTVTSPIQSELGWIIVKVDSIKHTAGKTLEMVRTEIIETLSAQKKQSALADLVTRVEDALSGGSTFDEVARDFKLAAQETAPTTATGTVEGAQISPEAMPLLKSAFEMAEDDDPEVETLGTGANENYAMLDVVRIIPAAPPALAQIQNQVRADFIATRAANRARETAAAIVAKINAGMQATQAFQQTGLKLPPVQAVNARRMEISQGGNQVPPPLAMLFSMKRGTAKLLEAPNKAGWFVVHLTATEAGDAGKEPGLIQATRQQFSQIAGEEYARQFSRAVEKQLDVERDADAIAALKKQLQGPGAR
jgi:peptidyl-prolyl cis-trans isomerase D